ncbi:MAG: hypothetical protein M3550_07365 [Actinomycetota bacterium]|nr:hypothetical protein [Actinomycetota bacterium]
MDRAIIRPGDREDDGHRSTEQAHVAAGDDNGVVLRINQATDPRTRP